VNRHAPAVPYSLRLPVPSPSQLLLALPDPCSTAPVASIICSHERMIFCGEIKLSDGNDDLRKSRNLTATVKDMHGERLTFGWECCLESVRAKFFHHLVALLRN
jgi:hypothetical protein